MRRKLPITLVVGILALCASGGVTRSPAAAPASPSEGRFLWQDLVTTDAAAARQFYGALLGWKFKQTSRSGRTYLLASTSAGPVGGIVDVRDIKDASSHWVSYVSVADVDRAVQQVQTGGGKVVVPAANLAVGRVSVVVDPQGAALGLIKPTADPPDPGAPVTGHFFWHEYLARDGGTAVEFYKTLLGYSAKVSDTRLGLEYFVLERDKPHAGLFQLPATASQVKPNWLSYVLVSDPAALAAKAAGLGGRVLLEPSPERRGGTLAIVADPTGGVVALQKYPM